MKLFYSVLLVAFSAGCVAGPDEIAAEKDKQRSKTAQSSAPSSEIPVVETASASISSEGFQTTATGLKYRIVSPGTGKKPTARSTVRCNYRGWLDNGKEFDNSNGTPIEFGLGGVIPGWTEGLQLISEGGEIELQIPSRLGYGERGMPPVIPPSARLHFNIQLVSVR